MALSLACRSSSADSGLQVANWKNVLTAIQKERAY